MKTYKEMTRAERRIAVAKDVIKQLKLGTVIAEDDVGYIDKKREEVLGELDDFREWLKTLFSSGKSCNVCALGSLVISKALKFDAIKTDDIMRDGHYTTRSTCELALYDIFTLKQLDDIENAFEGWDNLYAYNNGSTINYRYANWPDYYPNPSERIIAIMKNIIRNNGTFKKKDFGLSKKEMAKHAHSPAVA